MLPRGPSCRAGCRGPAEASSSHTHPPMKSRSPSARCPSEGASSGLRCGPHRCPASPLLRAPAGAMAANPRLQRPLLADAGTKLPKPRLAASLEEGLRPGLGPGSQSSCTRAGARRLPHPCPQPGPSKTPKAQEIRRCPASLVSRTRGDLAMKSEGLPS